MQEQEQTNEPRALEKQGGHPRFGMPITTLAVDLYSDRPVLRIQRIELHFLFTNHLHGLLSSFGLALFLETLCDI
jgi:hypothetical protein